MQDLSSPTPWWDSALMAEHWGDHEKKLCFQTETKPPHGLKIVSFNEYFTGMSPVAFPKNPQIWEATGPTANQDPKSFGCTNSRSMTKMGL